VLPLLQQYDAVVRKVQQYTEVNDNEMSECLKERGAGFLQSNTLPDNQLTVSTHRQTWMNCFYFQFYIVHYARFPPAF